MRSPEEGTHSPDEGTHSSRKGPTAPRKGCAAPRKGRTAQGKDACTEEGTHSSRKGRTAPRKGRTAHWQQARVGVPSGWALGKLVIDREAWRAAVRGVAKSRTGLSD